ncbi:MAG: hypothetical protein OXD42_10815, partial [Rhodospirillaceae bacterium]|nr:hypothetical protein [Rhodospirillaceae bacterium]
NSFRPASNASVPPIWPAPINAILFRAMKIPHDSGDADAMISMCSHQFHPAFASAMVAAHDMNGERCSWRQRPRIMQRLD